MVGHRGLPELEHLGDDDDAAAVAGQGRQRGQGGGHGVDVGVVGVVDEQNTTRAVSQGDLVHLHAMRALNPDVAQHRGDGSGGDSGGHRQSRGGQGVDHVVRAGQRQAHATGVRQAGSVQVEARPGAVPHSHISGAQVGAAPGRREGQHVGGGQRRHGEGPLVIGVEHRRAGGHQAGDDLALGRGDAVDGTEAPHVGVPDHEHGGGVQRGDPGEVGDVPGTGGTHLQNEVAGGLVGLQDGQRQPDLIVEGGRRRDGGTLSGQQLAGEILSRGLADRPGHGHDRQHIAPGAGAPAQIGQVTAGELAERPDGIGDDQQRE